MPKIVKVTWLDACQKFATEYNTDDLLWELTAELGVVNISTGWLLLLNEDFIVISNEISEVPGPSRGVFEIPTALILEVEYIA